MTDVMQNLVSEAKRNKYSGINESVSDEDVISVWDNVSGFIEKHMCQQKGVNIPGLGLFTFTQQKMDVGNNKYLLMQRPVFLLSEKLAITHGLKSTKHHTTGQIPVVQLNFAALSQESPFNRDTVEACVKDVLLALARSFGVKNSAEFVFTGIGRLQIQDSKVKMKFYKEFINMMDSSGKLITALKNRPDTGDSVMSNPNRSPSRPHSNNTLVLPRITQGLSGLAPTTPVPLTDRPSSLPMPTIREEGLPAVTLPEPEPEESHEEDLQLLPDTLGLEDANVQEIIGELKDDTECHLPAPEDTTRKLPSPPPGFVASRTNSRIAAPVAKLSGVNFTDHDFFNPLHEGMRGASSLSKSSPAPLMSMGRRSLSPLINSATPRLGGVSSPLIDNFTKFPRSKSVDRIQLGKVDKLPSPAPPGDKKENFPPRSPCEHKNAGQELCYLCHQRDRLNIPVSFADERKKKEQEEDRLLQQYQHLKDAEAIMEEQERLLDKRHDCQKMAAFNLGVSEAIMDKGNQRSTDFHPSYVFQRRPLTPPKYIKQNQYSSDLAVQVSSKDELFKRKKADEEFLERLEQVQLAEDLAAQRQQYLQDKADQQDQYKRALSAQVRFKPLPIPARVSDSNEPVFGKYDMVNEMVVAKRRRAHDLYQEQLATVEQRKREAILKRIAEQTDESDMLTRTKKELREDRAGRYNRLFHNRRQLETDWSNAVDLKCARESEERLLASSPGMLLHEQCDKYHRCKQCKRQVRNCGESNIWRESRYIPGSRLMV